MLDILGDYCNFKKWKYCRLDGSMNFLDRQANIDKFNQDPNYNIFLLSTRAGGLGINLTAADTCIIYDSGKLNPFNSCLTNLVLQIGIPSKICRPRTDVTELARPSLS